MNNIKDTVISKYTKLNYLYLAIVLLWRPLQGTILSMDGKGRTIMFLTIVVFILNYNNNIFRRITQSKPIIFWLIWCIYASINTYIMGYDHPNTNFFYFVVNQLLCPCIIMIVTTYEYLNNSKRLLKWLLSIFLLYAFIGTFVMDIGYVAMKEGNTNANTLGNLLALNVMMIVFFAGFLFCRKDITIKRMIIFILFAIGIVVISATRKALGAGFIMIIGIILSQVKLNIDNIVKMTFPVILMYYIFNFIMSNTQMGERLNEIDEQAESVELEYDIKDNFFLKAMGDRAHQYIIGFQIFKDKPISGVGLKNYQRETNSPYCLHTEYMVQICECGIIGCLLFIAFYVNIIKCLLAKFRKGGYYKSIAIMLFGGIVAILFTSLTAWTYSFPFYFAVLGTIIGFIHSKSAI